MEDLGALLTLATTVAREAGALLLDRLRQERIAVATKSTSTDMVSEVDRASEALLVQRIRAARPGDAIRAEEGSARRGSSGVCWVLDPLDGTTNYLYGFPAFSVSVAVEIDGVAAVGVVHDPVHDESFSALRGGGAHLNGEAIAVSGARELAHALVGTGFSYRSDQRAWQAAVVGYLLPRIRDIRRAGSAALDLCWVACGRLDATYERGLQDWDRAAGALIVEEAGGVVQLETAPWALSLSAAPGVAAEFATVVAEAERAAGDRPQPEVSS